MLQAARSGQADALALLAGLIADLTQPAIARATAANHLAELGEPALPSLRQALQDPEALVRAQAIPAFAEQPPVARVRLLLPLLDDPRQAVRDEVALTGGVASDRSQLAYLLALLLAERGAPEEALQWLDRTAKGQPQNARIRYNQGLLLWQLGRTDAARLALERGLALADEDAELLYALAYLYGATGERQKAHLYLQRLERLQPDDPRVRPLKQQLFSRP